MASSQDEKSPLLGMNSFETSFALVEEDPNVRREISQLLCLAGPIIVTSMLEFLPGTIAIALVGHIQSPLTKEFVDSVALSAILLNLTGLSIGFGLATALDTLCSQAVGAGKLHHLGGYLQCSMLVLGASFVFTFLMHWYAESLLLLLHQDPTTAALTGAFARIQVLGVPGLYLYELIKKVLQAQSIVSPMVYIMVLSNLLYCLLAYCLCYYTNLGYMGPAYARVFTGFLMTALALSYLWFVNPVYKLWWPVHQTARGQYEVALKRLPEYLSLGIPGMCMLVVEWWAFEVCTVLAGWLPNPVLSLSVQSVLTGLTTQPFSIFLGLNIATTIRVGNALGANEPKRAKVIAGAAMAVATAAGGFVGLVFATSWTSLAQLFINDAASIAAIEKALVWFVLFEVIDALCLGGQGVLKGMGKQSLGALANALAFYIVGIPTGALLAFQADMGVKGLWIGLAAGLFFAAAVYLVIVGRTNWKQMAAEAMQRSFAKIN